MSASAGPLVTVVTPFYNVEAYLARCIESVLAQTYPHWEHVLVNNRSTDRSLEIAEEYARRDPRIRIRTNDQFLPSIANQNLAIQQVSPASAYGKVVHADDWIFPRCLEEMVALAERHPSVGIVGAYRLDGTEVTLDGLPPETTVLSGREICRRYLLEGFYVFGSPTSLLIRSEIIRARPTFYDGAHPWADVEACFEILADHDFGFVHQVLTYSRRHPEAMSFQARRFEGHRITELAVLDRYGRSFLSEAEYELRRRVLLRRYYRFLLRSAFLRRSGAFWKVHQGGAQAIGLRFSPLKSLELSAAKAVGFAARPLTILASAVLSRQSQQ